MADSSTPPARTGAATDSATAKKLAARDRAVAIRVKAVAPKGSSCIILHRSNSTLMNVGIQLCHCFGRANSFNDILMRSIEFRWGMDHGSLSLDSRWNCIFIVSDFHAMFDNGAWCLVPSIATLRSYESATTNDINDEQAHRNRGALFRGKELMSVMQKNNILLDGDETAPKYHVYTLLALNPEMELTPILRYNQPIPRKQSDFTLYTFPFKDDDDQCLQIKSHLHPKFVILSLGKQLTTEGRIPEEFRKQKHVEDLNDNLDLVKSIYKKWTKELDDAQLNDDTHFPRFIPTPVAKSKYDREGPSYRPPDKSRMRAGPGSGPRTRSVSRRERGRTPSPMGNIPRVSADDVDGQADGEKTDGECDAGSDEEGEDDDDDDIEEQGGEEGDHHVEEQGPGEGDRHLEEQEEVGSPFPEIGNADNADYEAASSDIEVEQNVDVSAWGQGIKRDASQMASSPSKSPLPFPSSPTGYIESVRNADVPAIEGSSRRGRSPAKKKVRDSAN
ncbi:hypothetical protein CVT24_009484 [Panaeolus cyanescens]|uniref:HNH nuclease domain-containing protein n=1 Tax=Panaeolus cyanescens TaxID=181874 RepID=A0A409WEK2_9AGAR|nr:hypothetical protein CVT24_009484 [Panaeolus cyanescens]